MKTKDILIIGAIGVGAYYLLSRKKEQTTTPPDAPFMLPQIPGVDLNPFDYLNALTKGFLDLEGRIFNNLAPPAPKANEIQVEQAKRAALPTNFNNMAQSITDAYQNGLITLKQANTQVQVLQTSISSPIPAALSMPQTIKTVSQGGGTTSSGQVINKEFATNYKGQIIGNPLGYKTYAEARQAEATLGRGYK